MLVHKKSHGILTTVTVEYNDIIKQVSADVDSLIDLGFELNIYDWWIVRDRSPLARRILRCYPEFYPITDEYGELVDIIDLKRAAQDARRRREKEDAERLQSMANAEAYARGYSSARMSRVVPKSLAYLGRTLKKIAGMN